MDSKTEPPERSSPFNAPNSWDQSTSSIDGNAQTSLDNRPLARQKRRRTSPEDQAILEAAYKSDPKPDKAARLELVNQTSLGEKEVQIWYQNRRQSSRRKSRPLLPHEIAQYQASRATILPNDPHSNHYTETGVRYSTGTCNDDASGSSVHSDTSDGAESGDCSFVGDNQEGCPATATFTGPDAGPAVIDPTTGVKQNQAPCPAALSRTSSTSAYDFSARIGYLANRRSEPTLHRSLSTNSMPPPAPVAGRERQLKKSSSLIRLSLDSEGKAVVTTKDASSPSPPRPQQFVLPEAIPIMDSVPSLPPISNLKRSLSGRSRDSRSWEFWCDKESRNELEDAAVNDAKGSAAAAIGLLRTASGRSVLGSLSSKRNAAFPSRADPVKRSKHEHKRSAFQRSSTSFGRLQSMKDRRSDATPLLKHSESATSMHLKGNDSDKENWSPLGEGHSRGQDLRQERNATVRQRSFRHPLGTGEEQTDPEADPELSAFMGGGRSAKASQEDDLDCIQGLLSLSQGNWR